MGIMDEAGVLYGLTTSFPSHAGVLSTAIQIFLTNEDFLELVGSWEESGKDSSITEFMDRGPVRILMGVLVVVLLGLLALSLLQYAFQVIVTLAIVESPPAISLSLDPKRSRKLVAVLGIDTPQTYVTSSLCGALKHLRASAGAFAPWRGWSAHVMFVVVFAMIKGLMGSLLKSYISEEVARPLTGVVCLILLTRFAMTCTHIIISRPQRYTWVSRYFATRKSAARHSTPAMVYFALAHTTAVELCCYGANVETPYVDMTLFLAGLFVSVFVAFPCLVALIRIQASLLPSDEESIVSFDRSFGTTGEVVAISFVEALRSVGCVGWKRIYGVAFKAAGVLAGASVIFGTIVGLGMFWATSHPISAKETVQSLTNMALISLAQFFGGPP